MFENRVLGRIFGPKSVQVTGGWKKLYNKELHNFYSSTSKIWMIKSSRMKWAEHATRMGRRGMSIGYRWKSWKGKVHYEDLDVCGWLILR
jgi:hypothetical protein